MKNIASLAADDRMSKKKRKAGSGKFPFCQNIPDADMSPEDMFGADDADWAIYRKIVKYSHYACASSTQCNWIEYSSAFIRRRRGLFTASRS
jgi:hypothetical protein